MLIRFEAIAATLHWVSTGPQCTSLESVTLPVVVAAGIDPERVAQSLP